MILTEHTPIKGDLEYVIRHRDGSELHFVERNLVVDVGRGNLAHLLAGAVTNRSVTQIGFGTNSDAAASTDTGLTNAFTKNVGSVTYPDSTSVQFEWSLGFTEANGKAITEFGLLCANGDLFSRRVRDVINKTSDLSLSGTWKIQF